MPELYYLTASWWSLLTLSPSYQVSETPCWICLPERQYLPGHGWPRLAVHPHLYQGHQATLHLQAQCCSWPSRNNVQHLGYPSGQVWWTSVGGGHTNPHYLKAWMTANKRFTSNAHKGMPRPEILLPGVTVGHAAFPPPHLAVVICNCSYLDNASTSMSTCSSLSWLTTFYMLVICKPYCVFRDTFLTCIVLLYIDCPLRVSWLTILEAIQCFVIIHYLQKIRQDNLLFLSCLSDWQASILLGLLCPSGHYILNSTDLLNLSTHIYIYCIILSFEKGHWFMYFTDPVLLGLLYRHRCYSLIF